jgi:hypothetical protein
MMVRLVCKERLTGKGSERFPRKKKDADFYKNTDKIPWVMCLCWFLSRFFDGANCCMGKHAPETTKRESAPQRESALPQGTEEAGNPVG